MRMKRLWLCLPVLVLCLPLVIFLAGAASQAGPLPQPGPVVSEVVAETAGDPMAELAKKDPVAFLEKCLERYDKEVRGYNCTLEKQERLDGVVQSKEVTENHFQEQPFRIYMHWLQGARKAET